MSPGEKTSASLRGLPPFKPRIDFHLITIIARWLAGLFILGVFLFFVARIYDDNQRRALSEQQTQAAQPTNTYTPRPTNTRTPTSTRIPTRTPTTIPLVYECDRFYRDTLAYSISTFSDDFRTVHPKENRGEYFVQSVEVIVGKNNPAYEVLAEIHAAVFCFDTVAEARSFFNRSEGLEIHNLGTYNIDSSSFYGPDKYQLWFIDENIVVQMKGEGRYSYQSTSIEQETLNQALQIYRKIRNLPKVDPRVG